MIIYYLLAVEASEELGGNRSDTETLVRSSAGASEKEFLLTTRPSSARTTASTTTTGTPKKTPKWKRSRSNKPVASYIEVRFLCFF